MVNQLSNLSTSCWAHCELETPSITIQWSIIDSNFIFWHLNQGMLLKKKILQKSEPSSNSLRQRTSYKTKWACNKTSQKDDQMSTTKGLTTKRTTIGSKIRIQVENCRRRRSLSSEQRMQASAPRSHFLWETCMSTPAEEVVRLPQKTESQQADLADVLAAWSSTHQHRAAEHGTLGRSMADEVGANSKVRVCQSSAKVDRNHLDPLERQKHNPNGMGKAKGK